MEINKILRCRYRICDIIGESPQANSYLAEDIDKPFRDYCIIREIKPGASAEAGRDFRKIARIIYKLGIENPCFPKLLASFEDDGKFYLVSGFVAGQQLSELIIPGRKLPELEVVMMLQNILETLLPLHSKNIAHGSVNSINLNKLDDDLVLVLDVMAIAAVDGHEVLASTSKDIKDVALIGTYALTGIPPEKIPVNPKTGELIWQSWANCSKKTTKLLQKMFKVSKAEGFQSAFDALEAVVKLKKQLSPKKLEIPRPLAKVIITIIVVVTAFALGTQAMKANSGYQIRQVSNCENIN